MRVLCSFVAACALILCAANAGATSYYVDSSRPDNSGAGTSPSTAWKDFANVNSHTFVAGDSILLIRGGSWTGAMKPCNRTCSGSSTASIKIDAYGTGAAPLINGAGAPAAIELGSTAGGQSYWEIRNLEITNTGASPGNYWGISVMCRSASVAACHHIYIGYNTIHNINGLFSDQTGWDYKWQSGGVHVGWYLFQATSNYYDDVVIEHNAIYDVNALAVETDAFLDGGVDPTCAATTQTCGVETIDCYNAHTKTTNVAVRYNTLTCVGGGVLDQFTSGATIEHNTISQAGRSFYGTGGCSNPLSGEGGVGIMTAGTANTVIKYNEIYDGAGANPWDGEAIDADYGSLADTIEYNYTHGNESGFLLLWEAHRRTLGLNPFGYIAHYDCHPGCAPAGQCDADTTCCQIGVCDTGGSNDPNNGRCMIDVCDSDNSYLDAFVARFNISINDAPSFSNTHPGRGIINFCGAARDPSQWSSCTVDGNSSFQVPFYTTNAAQFYNNTIYMDLTHAAPVMRGACYEGQDRQLAVTEVNGVPNSRSFYFYNNIVRGPVFSGTCQNNPNATCSADFECPGSYCNDSSWIDGATGTWYANNDYVGINNKPTGGTNDCDTCDPGLLAPDALGSNGIYPPVGMSSLAGFKLKSGAQALSTGFQNGALGPVDLFGNAVPSSGAVSRGAYDGPAISVSIDSRSGWFMPSTSAEWTSLLSSTGLSNPSSLWKMQESTGSLADSIGTATFNVGGGSPLYLQSVSGWMRRSVKPHTSSSVDYFGAWISNISTTSGLLLMVVRFNSAPTALAGIMFMSDGVEINGLEVDTSGHVVARNKANSATGSVSVAGKTVLLIVKVDRSIPQLEVYNDGAEVLKPTWSAPGVNDHIAYFGAFEGVHPWPDASVLYGAYWSGTNAQLTDAQVATLISTIKNGR